MASKRLLLYASDTYRLSSLLLRRVLLTQPITLSAYREKTRQLLLDTSRSTISVPNVAAIKLLEWDRELNLIQYHGVQEYGKRWWASSSWSKLASRGTIGGDRTNDTQSNDVSNDSKEGDSNKKNVARVAFMITSEQRHKLTTKLGYTAQDIRTFKPIEALLLLEHNVQRQIEGRVEYDFRVELGELVKENESLSMVENEDEQILQSSLNEGASTAEIETSSSTNNQQSISPEEAEQVHAKPDVAMALLSVDQEKRNEENGSIVSSLAVVNAEEEESIAKSEGTANSTADTAASTETNDKHQTSAVETPSPKHPSAISLVEVTPNDSEELHMKPDVAAAVLTSHAQNDTQTIQESLVDGDDEFDEDEGCWYEVIEKLPITRAASANEGDGGEQVIALFSTKKEACECVSIKESFGKTRQQGKGLSYFVRRRWNV